MPSDTSTYYEKASNMVDLPRKFPFKFKLKNR